MMTPITIAHLSDFHISAEHRRNYIKRTRRALEYARSLGADHIIVTGDITANGDEADYRIARSLFASEGLLDAQKVTVLVGNHDVFGGVHTAEDVLTFPKRCKTTHYEAKIRAFADAFHETFEHTMRHSEKRFFPFTKILGELAIIGVNTVAAYSRLRNPLGSNGEVDDHAFKILEEMLESPLLGNKRKIVALHHHFHKMRDVKADTMHSVWGAIEKHTMKLRGKSRLMKLFAKSGVDLVLHGHVHESFEYVREGLRFLNAGGSVLHDRSRDLHVNVIRVAGEGCRVETHRLTPVPGSIASKAQLPVLRTAFTPHQEAA
jgi:3',5'-cyclic AMP phosphodiesterase CpdA